MCSETAATQFKHISIVVKVVKAYDNYRRGSCDLFEIEISNKSSTPIKIERAGFVDRNALTCEQPQALQWMDKTDIKLPLDLAAGETAIKYMTVQESHFQILDFSIPRKGRYARAFCENETGFRWYSRTSWWFPFNPKVITFKVTEPNPYKAPWELDTLGAYIRALLGLPRKKKR